MSRLLKIVIAVFAVGFCANAYPIDYIKSEKIKIISAYCLSGEWSFKIFDGVSNNQFTLQLGVGNPKGFLIESFDETTETAKIQTPRGSFLISMNKPRFYYNEEIPNPQPTDTVLTFSRKNILENIK